MIHERFYVAKEDWYNCGKHQVKRGEIYVVNEGIRFPSHLRHQKNNTALSYTVLKDKQLRCVLSLEDFRIVFDTKGWKPKVGDIVYVSDNEKGWFQRMFIAEYEGRTWVNHSSLAQIDSMSMSLIGWKYHRPDFPQELLKPIAVEMSIPEIEKRLGIKNLKITK